MTRPQIHAIIDDGPRAGDKLALDTDKDAPPREIMLPDGHLGIRPEGATVPHATGSVSRYRLIEAGDVESGDQDNYHYKVVPHDQ